MFVDAFEGIWHLHSNSRDAVSGVKERDIPSVDPALWWPPRHDQDVNLDQVEKYQEPIPHAELRRRELVAAATPTHQPQADGQSEVEHGLGVRFEADDESERVPGWRSSNHDKGHGPFEDVRPQRSSKWLC